LGAQYATNMDDWKLKAEAVVKLVKKRNVLVTLIHMTVLILMF